MTSTWPLRDHCSSSDADIILDQSSCKSKLRSFIHSTTLQEKHIWLADLLGELQDVLHCDGLNGILVDSIVQHFQLMVKQRQFFSNPYCQYNIISKQWRFSLRLHTHGRSTSTRPPERLFPALLPFFHVAFVCRVFLENFAVVSPSSLLSGHDILRSVYGNELYNFSWRYWLYWSKHASIPENNLPNPTITRKRVIRLPYCD